MSYISETDIRRIVAGVMASMQQQEAGDDSIPVEVSARHVHLTKEAVAVLFGPGHQLTPKKMLSQPGEFLSEDRVKLVTPKGQIADVAVLGPERSHVQVELSQTDTRALGINAPICLSGELKGAKDILIVGPQGNLEAKECVMIALAHVHMTPEDAQHYGVHDGQRLSLSLNTKRPITMDNVIVRVKDPSKHQLAMHIDFDEANACCADGSTRAIITKRW